MRLPAPTLLMAGRYRCRFSPVLAVKLTYCKAGTLVEPRLWLPEEPFDYVWGRFGCNHLICGSCKQPVHSSIREGQLSRHYECRCQERDEFDIHEIGSDAHQERGFETSWRCNGHPQLQLPTVLDGEGVSELGSYEHLVARTLAAPPFVAPGFRGKSFWVRRLFRLMPTEAQRSAISRAVAEQLSSDDASVVRAALDFFEDAPWAEGVEALAVIGERRAKWLRGTTDPERAERSLYKRLLDAINVQLLLSEEAPSIDQNALAMARAAVLGGEASVDLLMTSALRDPTWFSSSIVEIYKANPREWQFILRALDDVSSKQATQAIERLCSVDEKTEQKVRRWLKSDAES